VVDYRALLTWATWADGQIGRNLLETTNLEVQLAIVRATADDTEADLIDAQSAYADEHRMRLAADARAIKLLPRWTTIGVGIIASLEALALSAASIALAAR
jgi:hypothetical protein